MSPVDEVTHKEIMNEFAKDKEQVDRFRKEQVRREIHDTKLRKQQESGKKLELLSLTKQRELEKKESQRAENEKKITEASTLEESKIQKAKDLAKLELQVSSQNKDNILPRKEKRDFKKDQFFILIGSFYREDTAIFLKQRINKEIPKFDTNKLKIIKKSNKKINLVSGPYNTINVMKNDYFELKKFGFEDLDISTNE